MSEGGDVRGRGAALLATLVVACSSGSDGGGPATGGGAATGSGAQGGGGNPGSGASGGGDAATGGAAASGGAVTGGTGGTFSGTGGTSSGADGGGAAGASAAGGVGASGSGTGGGGSGGTSAAGGGGSGGAPTACTTPLADRLHVSTVDVGAAVVSGDEYHPVLVAPRTGGSLLAYRAAGADLVRVLALDAADALVGGTLLEVEGREAHALTAAQGGGGALVAVSLDPDIFSPKYCKSDATPDAGGDCQKVDLIRFDDAGQVSFRTTLTKKANVDSDGALFVWWYQHTARVVEGGGTFGVYFRSAGSSPRPGVPGEIDIHAGDTLRFVGTDGQILAGAGWDWGCSHSWAVRLAYAGQFAAACHGDAYPNALRVAFVKPEAGSQVVTRELAAGTDPTGRALGDVVPVSGGGFWMTYLASDGSGRSLHLVRFDAAGSVVTDGVVAAATGLDEAYPFRAYLARYGEGRLLLGWKSAGMLTLAVADAGTGALVDGPSPVMATIDAFTDFVSTPGGDVVWAAPGGSASTLRVHRVAGCN